jgi:excisionase family DNA binding protein
MTAVAGQLAAAGAAARDIALQAGTTHPCLRLALTILWAARDLAGAVRAGQLDLTSAHLALNAHQHPAHDALCIAYLTVAEVAALLRISRTAVYRLIGEEKLQAVRAGPRSTRIPEPSVCRYLTGQAITAVEQLAKLGVRPPVSQGSCAAQRRPAVGPRQLSGTWSRCAGS